MLKWVFHNTVVPSDLSDEENEVEVFNVGESMEYALCEDGR